MRGVKRARQIVGNDLHQVAGRAKPPDAVQRDQLLIFHDVVCASAPAPASVAGIAPFLDVVIMRQDLVPASNRYRKDAWQRQETRLVAMAWYNPLSLH